ncbi:DNA-3-methyladenine glycosylase family protein [Herbaspirillum robiniae]|uniref:DNA-3-methyladenine glycosylase II n=1 Tax=Herbaspirillum robiniae TaxID=2014887 RepID=A0ABX2M3M1_9BURK|nr:AlkA N-terminal domain-containing protein [Herbaspirillum robiniae]NUU04323.1 DNA-3-methyladenine glycosylase 2 family protein [Herbaspirillum robiniae]
MPKPAIAVLHLPYQPPFDWPRMLRFFNGRATIGVEAVENGAYLRAIEWEGDAGTLAVTLDAAKHCLVATLAGKVSRHADALAAPLSRMFDLQADPAAVKKALGADPWLKPLLKAAPGLRVPGAWSAFELVVRTIIGQQVSVKAATTIMGRVVQRAGQHIPDHGHALTAWRFPTPAALADADLSSIGMPGKRVAALQGLARAVAEGAAVIDPPGQPYSQEQLAQLRQTLLAQPGIGPWTVEYVAMRAWRDPDGWPATDLVLMQAIAARDAALVKPAQQKQRSLAWAPYRAYVAQHLWNEIADRANGERGG